jgi:hypothetical protein
MRTLLDWLPFEWPYDTAMLSPERRSESLDDIN